MTPIHVRGDVSSQFLTALLLALPLAAHDNIMIDVVGELISKPYVEITLNLLQRFGIVVRRDGWQRFTIPAGSHYHSPATPCRGGRLVGQLLHRAGRDRAARRRRVRIEGVGADRSRATSASSKRPGMMGARVAAARTGWRCAWRLAAQAIDLDCNHIPDAAMTLAVMALTPTAPSTLRNIASWRVKETDRIAAMATELRKLGATVEEGDDFIARDAAASWRAGEHPHLRRPPHGDVLFAGGLQPAARAVRIQTRSASPRPFPTISRCCSPPCFRDAAAARASDLRRRPHRLGQGHAGRPRSPRRLGYHYLDSGALYRITGLAATRAGPGAGRGARGTPSPRMAADAADPASATARCCWASRTSPNHPHQEAGMNASRVSALPGFGSPWSTCSTASGVCRAWSPTAATWAP